MNTGGANGEKAEQPTIEDEVIGRPPYANLFNVTASKSDLFVTLGCTLPEVVATDAPSVSLKQVYFERFVTSREGGEILAKLLVRLLWGPEAEEGLTLPKRGPKSATEPEQPS